LILVVDKLCLFTISPILRIKSDKNETPTMILDLIHKPSLVQEYSEGLKICVKWRGKGLNDTPLK